ncbi:MAG: glycoside hydrolase domain-containing protein, partial [Terriglobales bacterium]
MSPAFSRDTMQLQAPYAGNQCVIAASPNPAADDYIQRVAVDGHALGRDWIWFHQITSGATMQVTLGANPNRTWAAAPADAAPSLSHWG